MRYFAMIDGEQRGPFELSELTRAGVRPDTYVWCKGMVDWEKAEDVADICRYFRQTIFDHMHPSQRKPAATAADGRRAANGSDPNAPMRGRLGIFTRWSDLPEVPQDTPKVYGPPAPTLFIAIFLTLFCFPITGFVAIYFSYKARQTWTESMRSESKKGKVLYNDKEREDLRILAHDYDRQAKMWIGITFFIGMIFYAFMVNYGIG